MNISHSNKNSKKDRNSNINSKKDNNTPGRETPLRTTP